MNLTKYICPKKNKMGYYMASVGVGIGYLLGIIFVIGGVAGIVYGISVILLRMALLEPIVVLLIAGISIIFVVGCIAWMYEAGKNDVIKYCYRHRDDDTG